jgi:hypothetical protein
MLGKQVHIFRRIPRKIEDAPKLRNWKSYEDWKCVDGPFKMHQPKKSTGAMEVLWEVHPTFGV